MTTSNMNLFNLHASSYAYVYEYLFTTLSLKSPVAKLQLNKETYALIIN